MTYQEEKLHPDCVSIGSAYYEDQEYICMYVYGTHTYVYNDYVHALLMVLQSNFTCKWETSIAT